MGNNIWTLLRGRLKRPEPISLEESAARVAAVVAHMRAHERPCLHLAPRTGRGKSWLGGEPQPSIKDSWPRWDEHPLSFLAQLNLEEIRQAGGPDWLPACGRLLFFFDPVRFDHFDRRGWSVRHLSSTSDSDVGAIAPGSGRRLYNQRAVGFEKAASWPLYDRSWHLTRGFSDRESAAIEEALGTSETAPAHQIDGYPAPVQSDGMEADCQQAWREIFGEQSREAAIDDWRLLLQLDSDEALGANWGDGGTLYFWIRESDARAGDFSRTWLIFQCF